MDTVDTRATSNSVPSTKIRSPTLNKVVKSVAPWRERTLEPVVTEKSSTAIACLDGLRVTITSPTVESLFKLSATDP